MSYSDLVAAAAVGTSQRPLPVLPRGLVPEAGDEQTPADQLLDAAAAYAAVRRATLPLLIKVAAPDPAPAEATSVPPERFVAGLARLLGSLTDDQRPLPAATVRELLAEALGWVSAAGWRVPERMVVPVLERVAHDPGIRNAATAAVGERGRWLASLNPAWSGEAGPSVEQGERAPDIWWWEGAPALRHAYLSALRSRDPDAARELLAEGWATEAVDDRIAFTSLMAATATEADESFLVAAQKDRSSRVTDAARPGLLRIPTAQLLDRLRVLAREAVTVRRDRPGGPVTLAPPGEDPATLADLSVPVTYSQTSAEQRLNALVASIPPTEWPGLVGVRASDLLTAETDQSWSVVRGLTDAALFWGDAELAADLVARGVHTPALLRLLHPSKVARLLDDPAFTIDPLTLQQLVESWPRPWPTTLAQAVGSWLQLHLSQGQATARAIPAGLVGAAAIGVPVVVARGWAERLRGLATDARVTPAVQRTARHTAAALTLRAAMYDDVRAARDPVPSTEPTYLQEDR